MNAQDVSAHQHRQRLARVSRVTPTSGLVTTEAGGTATFTVVLLSQPTRQRHDRAALEQRLTEGTVAPATLTFTPLNWNAPQTVTVTGQDDAVDDGDQAYTIVTAAATSADPGYSGAQRGRRQRDEPRQRQSRASSCRRRAGLVTTEAGGSGTFTIVLHSQPTANVTIALASSDTTEGTVTPTSVTFTPANWNAPQTVTVTGVDDGLVDGDQVYTIVTDPATSADATYYGPRTPRTSA